MLDNYPIRLFLVIAILSIFSLTGLEALDFKKNTDLVNSSQSDDQKVKIITQYEEIRNIVFEEKQNSIILFYADWCPHCKDFHPIFQQASKYEIVSKWKFLEVNCSNKVVCEHFKVSKYPTIKVYINGETNDEEPSRDLESLLEYLDKLTSEPIIQLENETDLINFRENYGEMNFVIVIEKKMIDKNQMYSCVEKLAYQNLRSIFYFGVIDKKNYNFNQFKHYDEKQKLPDIITIEDTNDDNFFQWTDSSTCEDVEYFLKKNKFPYLIKINSHYIKRLQNESRILFMFAMNTPENDNHEKSLIFSDFYYHVREFSKHNRNIIFSYFDVEADNYLTSFFRIKKDSLPCLILYDFINRRYYVDYSDFKSNVNLNLNLNHIRDLLIEDKISWSHGNFIQDILSKFGINITERGSMILIGCFFIGILVILMILMFCFGESNDEEFELKKKEFIQQLAASNDLHEEEKKLILESKNFDSLVRMGLDKIIENLKGTISEEEKNEDDNKEDNLNSINDISPHTDKSLKDKKDD